MNLPKTAISGPTFEEMLHPESIDPEIRATAVEMKEKDPLAPINLYNITWKDPAGQAYYDVLPPEFTGVDAPIVVLLGKEFPTGSHKVGAAYAILIERSVRGEVDPAGHTLLWPSTGNYGIGGAWVGCRMNSDSVVVLPESMSQERFALIRKYGARMILTPGRENKGKEIYEKTQALRRADPGQVRILDQFESMGNYRFNYYVTGNTVIELAHELETRGIGNGRVSAFVSAMGSAGTIATGDRLKQVWPDHRIVGVEPVQCPTLFCNGHGDHDIQGIGDGHVTWIHNTLNMDAIMCVDGPECAMGLQLVAEEAGWKTMIDRFGVPEDSVLRMAACFGISGICNVLGAIKTAKFFDLGKQDVIVTVCTDGIDRYRSVVSGLTGKYGAMDEAEAAARLEGIFHHQKTDWVREATRETRNAWHNLKYFTWVEQRGKTVQELDAQADPSWWEAEQAKVTEIDGLIREWRA